MRAQWDSLQYNLQRLANILPVYVRACFTTYVFSMYITAFDTERSGWPLADGGRPEASPLSNLMQGHGRPLHVVLLKFVSGEEETPGESDLTYVLTVKNFQHFVAGMDLSAGCDCA